jgi:hypothetical protein
MATKQYRNLIFLILLASVYSGCDFFRKKKCEWYLIADESMSPLAKPGYASVCIRNYELNRQKCAMVIKLTEAEKVFSKKFRLSDLEVNEDVFPKEITSIKPCSQ